MVLTLERRRSVFPRWTACVKTVARHSVTEKRTRYFTTNERSRIKETNLSSKNQQIFDFHTACGAWEQEGKSSLCALEPLW